jgi:outer membrane murein-binding lipoprotein Lpp
LDAKVGAIRNDVNSLDAKVGAIRNDVNSLDANVDAIRIDVNSLDAKVDALRSDVAAHRAETKKGFAALDKELSGHADPIHRTIEREIAKLKKDVEAMKGRPLGRGARAPRRRVGK